MYSFFDEGRARHAGRAGLAKRGGPGGFPTARILPPILPLQGSLVDPRMRASHRKVEAEVEVEGRAKLKVEVEVEAEVEKT